MPLESAIKYIKSKNPTMPAKVEQKLIEALKVIDEAKGFLDTFSEGNLESLCKIEMINPDYFPGLSGAAARTMVTLHAANPRLPVSLLLTTAYNLTGRRRPWEALSAFSRIAESCPKQITEEMLTSLLKVKPDLLEISSHDIEKEAERSRKEKAGVIGVLSSFLSGPVVEVNITATIEKTIKAFTPKSYGYTF